MSLLSFRVLQDATGQQSSASTEKGDEHQPPRVCGRLSLSSFRVHQDATGQQSSASTEKVRTPTAARRGRMSLSSFRVQNTTGQQSSASTEKCPDETPRRRAAVGCRCHRSACNDRTAE
ncbi:hypothetical protein TNCV_1573761 [Trichonephila clavipes]|nr:hypothetical protein TNCV_1573761 [Trichonephila clavipes]